MGILRGIVVLGIVAAAAAFWVSVPTQLDPERLVDPATDTLWEADLTNGALVFAAMGCASCHAADGTDALAGGKPLVSDFGTFYAPNISTDTTLGIGRWTTYELANAVLNGVSPNGAHYYPAFPYGAYIKMTPRDVVDLAAYLLALP